MSQSEEKSAETEDDIAKKRNPFAKKIKSSQQISPNSKSSNIDSHETSDSGFYSQSAVEINSSQLSVCSIDADQVGLLMLCSTQ